MVKNTLIRSVKLAIATALPLLLGIAYAPRTEAEVSKVSTLPRIKIEENIFEREVLAKANIERGESLAQKKERTLATAKKTTPTVGTALAAPVHDPSLEEKRAVYAQVASKYGIAWQLLEAVHQIESGKRWYQPNRSSAGATGPMQFLPSTWRAYGQDGNGDGVADIMNIFDALHGAANYLAANGANRGDIDNALFRYNHSWSYVAKVKGIMSSI